MIVLEEAREHREKVVARLDSGQNAHPLDLAKAALNDRGSHDIGHSSITEGNCGSWIYSDIEQGRMGTKVCLVRTIL